MNYLFDTNHASKILEGDKPLSLKVGAFKNSGSRFSISMSILGELFFAVYASKRREKNLQQLKLFLEDVILLDYDIKAAEEFGERSNQNKRQKVSQFHLLTLKLPPLHGFTMLLF